MVPGISIFITFALLKFKYIYILCLDIVPYIVTFKENMKKYYLMSMNIGIWYVR